MQTRKMKRKDYIFWRQFNEKPSNIPGYPGKGKPRVLSLYSTDALVLYTGYSQSILERFTAKHIAANLQQGHQRVLGRMLSVSRRVCHSRTHTSKSAARSQTGILQKAVARVVFFQQTT